MRKRRIWNVVIVFIFAAVIFEGANMQPVEAVKQESGTNTKKETEDKEIPVDAIPAPAQETVLEIPQEEYAKILQCGSKSFFGGYMIDDSFLLWLDAAYGSDVIHQLAAYVEQEQAGQEVSRWLELTGNSIHVLWLEYCRQLQFLTYQFSNVTYVDTAVDNVFTMDFIGDVNFADDWYTMQQMNTGSAGILDCITDAVQKELQNADIAMLNNEFTYSSRGMALEGKAYTFRSDPKNVQLLGQLGIDLVSLANNHVCDYGDDALLDTLDTLQSAGIAYVGAGKNMEEASGICYYIANGRKIAVVSATQIEKTLNYTKEATETKPGVIKTLQPDRFLEVIREAESKSDFVIVYVHWGTEGKLLPDADVKNLSAAYVAAGADLILGNHPHRLQGAEFVEGVPVIYSMGNFWFSTGTLYTTIVQLKLQKDGAFTVAFLPCKQENLQVSFLSEQEEIEDFYRYIADLSFGIGMDENGILYDTLGGGYDIGEIGQFPYLSGKSYRSHAGDFDLLGRKIDIVGNLLP